MRTKGYIGKYNHQINNLERLSKHSSIHLIAIMIVFFMVMSVLILLLIPMKSNPSMITVLFASDVHTGESPPGVYNKSLDYFISDINITINPDILLLVGDITNNGMNWQWDAFEARLNNISDINLRVNKTVLTVGNHDLYSGENWSTIHQNFKNRFGYLPNYSFQIGNSLFIVLASHGTDICGNLSMAQIIWLNDTISTNTDKNIIIISHHPLQNTTWSTSLERCGYKNNQDKILHDMMTWHDNNVSLWIHGHRHGGMDFPNMMVKVGNVTYMNIASVECQRAPYLTESWLATFTDGSNNVSFRPRISNSETPYWNDSWIRYVDLKYPVNLSGYEPMGQIISEFNTVILPIAAVLVITASISIGKRFRR